MVGLSGRQPLKTVNLFQDGTNHFQMKKMLIGTSFLCIALINYGQFGLKSAAIQRTESLSLTSFKNERIRTGVIYKPTGTVKPTKIFAPQLTVTDSGRVKNNDWPELTTGNEPPNVAIDILQGNKTFFFPDKPIQYAVRVVDLEDGSLTDGRISPDRVTVQMDYFSTRFDSTTALLQTHANNELPMYATTQKLIFESDCRACHTVNKPGVGPTYARIAQKYKDEPNAVDRLARKVIVGGKGVWGEAIMSPHPQLSVNDAATIVTYILSLSNARTTATNLPVSGAYTPAVPEAETGEGYFKLLASYTDRGTQSSGPVRSEQVKFFRSPVLLPEEAAWLIKVQTVSAQPKSFYVIGPYSYIEYAQLDMTDINQVAIRAKILVKTVLPGGTIEVRLGSIAGKLIGKTTLDITRLIAPTDSSLDKTEEILIDLTPTTGIDNVYFVFKNPQAAAQQTLMQIDAFIVKATSASEREK